jgi:hypothetical protein
MSVNTWKKTQASKRYKIKILLWTTRMYHELLYHIPSDHKRMYQLLTSCIYGLLDDQEDNRILNA